jgi:GWxTD domain-containing protein
VRLLLLFLLWGGPMFAQEQAARPLAEYWFEDDEWHLDVQYIISAEELTKYRALKTITERDIFISEFWSHRDRDEFYRRVEFAKSHFADPTNPSHSGMETDRGRIYVLYGPPDRIDRHPSSFYEFWNYAAGQPPLTFQFSVPPVDSCDGSYGISSKPLATFGSDGPLAVELYPGHFITAFIRLVFSKTAGLSWSLRTHEGNPVLENDEPVLDGTYGPVPSGDSLAQHLFGCRLFGTDGMAFTHPIHAGAYTFSTTVTLTTGEVKQNTVPFEIP